MTTDETIKFPVVGDAPWQGDQFASSPRYKGANAPPLGGPVRSIDAAAEAVRTAAQRAAALAIPAEHCLQAIDETAVEIRQVAAHINAILACVQRMLGIEEAAS